eukprot:CAMPEP_0178774210 /NCGR_PEP_ID=MMETSP0744-20121128/23529_1 /TAXON_ID=913974 /ORGANISM="Nitzschia punctata, Strain CCMP561" /LENGTH=430 /DNA_ID=CAMNT_0020431089 /DNA_START=210 /DNA_END=1504 /DNA_ORIENTATION=-
MASSMNHPQGSSSNHAASRQTADIATNPNFFQLDGRNFHPVTQHEMVDDFLTPIGIEWDLPMSMGFLESHATSLAEAVSSSSRELTAVTAAASFLRNNNITDGESSDNSSVSTDIFEDDLEPTPIAPSSAVGFATAASMFAFDQLPGAICNLQNNVQQQQHAHQEHIFCNPGLVSTSADDTVVGDDDISLSMIASSQDHRFKPFHAEKWNARYKELLVFHKQHGHAAVPHSYPPTSSLLDGSRGESNISEVTEIDDHQAETNQSFLSFLPNLGSCFRQRRQYKLLQEGKQATLTPERLDILNSLGFIWDSHEVNWREKFDSLLEYKKQKGNCNVPSNHADKKLATWVKCQRRQYKLYCDGRSSSMTKERIDELNKVGFLWEIRNVSPTKGSSSSKKAEEKEQALLSSTTATTTLEGLSQGSHVKMTPRAA